MYDLAVEKRQNKVMRTAMKTQAVVSSLFPSSIQDRLLKDIEQEIDRGDGAGTKGGFRIHKRTKDKLSAFLQGEDGDSGASKSKPIADFFPEASILFADLVGFTAVSIFRRREPICFILWTTYVVY